MVSVSTGKESKQDYCTPQVFLDAVEKRLGRIQFDLAADWRTHVTNHYYTLDPDDKFSSGGDSLQQDWVELSRQLPPGIMWLNPPYADIAPWAKKCHEFAKAEQANPKLSIAFLVPASVGSNWFRDYCFQNSRVMFLNPRITFDGCKAPFPKDLMLCVFDGYIPTTEQWRWAPERAKKA